MRPIILALALTAGTAAHAHTDHRGVIYTGLRHPRTGVDCCSIDGAHADCKPVPWSTVQKVVGGWMIDDRHFVTDADVMGFPDPDGLPTVCRRHDGTVRCFAIPNAF